MSIRFMSTVDVDVKSSTNQQAQSLCFFVPSEYRFRIPNGTIKIYNLNIFQRIFVTLEWNCSCVLADIISKVVGLSIILSIISVIISSMERFQYQPKTCSNPACNNSSLCPDYMICAPMPYQLFNTIDFVCVIFFTIDYSLRLGLVAFVPTRLTGVVPFHWEDDEKELAVLTNRNPEKEVRYSKLKKFYKYFFSFHSLIDILCIVPFYVALSSNKLSLSFFRCIRLFRFLRLMKLSYKGALVVALLQRTVTRSWEAIVVLTFYLMILVFITGTLAYTFESGTFTVNSDYPKGQFLRKSIDQRTDEVSPYTSIPTSIYWAIVTATTVGYGDLSPTSTLGRVLGCVLSVLGVIVLALPISVIGNNFTREYSGHMKRVAKYELYSEYKANQIKQNIKTGFIDKVSILTPSSKVQSENNKFAHILESEGNIGINIEGVENPDVVVQNQDTYMSISTTKNTDNQLGSEFDFDNFAQNNDNNNFILKRFESVSTDLLKKFSNIFNNHSSSLFTTQDIETNFNIANIEMKKFGSEVKIFNKSIDNYDNNGKLNHDTGNLVLKMPSCDIKDEDSHLVEISSLSTEELVALPIGELVVYLQQYKNYYYKYNQIKKIMNA